MYQRTFYGETITRTATLPDIDLRERLALVPLVVLAIVMGIASPYWMKAIDPTAAKINSTHSTPVVAGVQR
jgi:NADH-quinone oxidoreductase subunit M